MSESGIHDVFSVAWGCVAGAANSFVILDQMAFSASGDRHLSHRL